MSSVGSFVGQLIGHDRVTDGAGLWAVLGCPQTVNTDPEQRIPRLYASHARKLASA